MLKIKHISLAKVEDLFKYKQQNIIFDKFPGYTTDQWGIKAHNRPWIIENGDFKKNQRILEVGGAYSTLPKYLADKFKLEAWIADDFGDQTDEKIWSRWGNPKKLLNKNKPVKYIFNKFGKYSKQFPNNYFDRIFSVSTLEHIHKDEMHDVILDMNRCLSKGGRQIHTIDLSCPNLKKCIINSIIEKSNLYRYIDILDTEITYWIKVFLKTGIKLDSRIPSTCELLNKNTLVESPDVVYRFYPPNGEPKKYTPNASLLIIID